MYSNCEYTRMTFLLYIEKLIEISYMCTINTMHYYNEVLLMLF